MSEAELHFVVVDAVDAEAGVLEVEFSEGFTAELPAWWLPEAREGAAYLVRREGNGLHFEAHPDGARALRERSKQTLLGFVDRLDE